MRQSSAKLSTQSRKQREIQEWEERILEISRPLLIEHGSHGLGMDRVAELLQYSKGTIYNHFSCKEEIIIALAIQTTEKRTRMLDGFGWKPLLVDCDYDETLVRIQNEVFPDEFRKISA